MEILRIEWSDVPVIGVTSSGQEMRLGGFSGLRFLGRTAGGLLRFVTHTDRGPNADERISLSGKVRPFGLPDFQPRLVFFEVDVKLRKILLVRQVPLRQKTGRPVTGRPPSGSGEIAVDFKGRLLGIDEKGLDLEGVAQAPDGSFWLADEYGPSLVHFSANGVFIEQLCPGRGLPETVRYRQPNRGFESIALADGQLFAALESPLDNPPSEGHANGKKSRITRFVQVDLARKVATAQFAYLMEEADGKLSDITTDGPNQFLVVEKGGRGEREWKRIYRVGIGMATNLQRLSSLISGPGGSLETMLIEDLPASGILVARKELVADLTALGLKEEKVEGIDRVEGNVIALITDNDFAVDGVLDDDNGVALEKTAERFPSLYLLQVPAEG
jgi:3-phytase